MERLRQCGYKSFGVHGEVYLWGKVVEHERGWRAQFAYPKTLFLAADTIPFSLSGFEAAGLDYLIKTRTEYYVCRQQERTLKKGDRVAVLGHGIAVVEQVDGKEVDLALGNRLMLRIGRKEIVVNEQNNRWECEATKARGYQVCE
jgi:hypothetical protein